MAPAALLFDLDGTIADTDPLHFETWRALLAEHGVAIDRPLYDRRFSGRLNPDIVAEFLPRLDRAANRALCDEKEARFRRMATRLDPLPGLLEFLAAARGRGLRTAVVTNAPPLNARHTLAATGLVEGWDTVVTSADVAPGKPDPAPYRLALARMGVAPGAAVAFEDSVAGVTAAVAAGLRTVALATSHDAAALRRAGAALVLRDFGPAAAAVGL